MYRLVIKNGFLYGIDELYSYTKEDKSLERISKFFIKVSNIAGCIEKLRFKSIGSDSYKDLEILLNGENKISVADIFRNKNLTEKNIEDIKEIIHSAIQNNRFDGCINF